MASPLRVALIVARLEFGGTQRLVMELMRGLDRARFDPILIHFKNPNHYAGEIADAGWRCHKVAMSRSLRPLEVRGLARKLAAERVQLVHTHADFANFAGRAAAVSAGVPWRIAHYHGHYLHSLSDRFRRLEAILAPHTDRILTCSQSVAEFVESTFELSGAPVQKVLNGMDLHAFERARERRTEIRQELGIGDGVFHIVHTGRLVAHKGPDRLISALASAGERLGRWRATFVGGGDLEEEMHKLAAAAERAGAFPQGSIIFTGWSDQVADYLAAGDVSVMCSHHEGLGLSAVESLAAGTPVVASDIAGIREVVVDGESGLLVDTSEPEQLLAALVQLREEDTLRTRLIEGGLRRTQLFSVRRYLDEVQSVYEHVVTENRPKPAPPRGFWQQWRILRQLANA